MQFDPRRRVYVGDDGSIVSPAELRQLIESYIEREKLVVDAQAQLLIAGSITAGDFFEWLREKIKEVHGAAGMVAYGGEDQMNHERWARIGQKVASETAYANGFESEFLNSEKVAEELIAEAVSALESSSGASLSTDTISALSDLVRTTAPASDIPAVAESLASDLTLDASEVKSVLSEVATADRIGQLVFGQTPSRASSYVEPTYATFENSTRDREVDAGVVMGRRVDTGDEAECDDCPSLASSDFMPLAEITDIGVGSACGGRCRCEIEFDYEGIGPLSIDRSIYAPGFQNVNA
jgi:hypothetical protein